MSELKGACVIGQSGGPTSVINSSVLGALEAALDNPSITRVSRRAAHGIQRPCSNDQLLRHRQGRPRRAGSSALHPVLCTRAPAATSWLIRTLTTPITSASSRSSRSTTSVTSSTTAATTPWIPATRSPSIMMKSGYECRVMGIPKTIDNDLFGTDHCPGFASAAKYIATSCMEIYQDARVYDTGMVCVVEIMGRHAGWLAGCCWSGYRSWAQVRIWFTCRRPTST